LLCGAAFFLFLPFASPQHEKRSGQGSGEKRFFFQFMLAHAGLGMAEMQINGMR